MGKSIQNVPDHCSLSPFSFIFTIFTSREKVWLYEQVLIEREEEEGEGEE